MSKIRNNHSSCTSRISTWEPYNKQWNRGRRVRRRRDELDDYWKGTIRQRIA